MYLLRNNVLLRNHIFDVKFESSGVRVFQNVSVWFDLSKESNNDYYVIDIILRNYHSVMSNSNSVAQFAMKVVPANIVLKSSEIDDYVILIDYVISTQN